MKKTNLLLTLVACGAIIPLATGCNKNKDNGLKANFIVPDNVFDGYSENNPISLSFYQTNGSTSSYGKTLQNYIDAFQEEFPYISVTKEQKGDYSGVLKTIREELAGGSGETSAHIATGYPDHIATYNEFGAVVQLDDLIASTKTVKNADGEDVQIGLTSDQIADFIPGYYNEGKTFGDGLQYCLPLSKSTEALFYNKTEFDRLELEVPTHWFSTDDNDKTSVEYACNVLRTAHPTHAALGYDSDENFFITIAEQLNSGYTSATGEHFIFDNETNRNVMKKFREWHKNGWLETGYTLAGSANDSTHSSTIFTNIDSTKPTCYMSIGSTAGASYQAPSNNAFEVGIAKIPQIGDSKKVISQGPSIFIFAKTNPAEVVASWLFIKYLTTSVNFQCEYSLGSGYIPVLKSAIYNKKYTQTMKGENLSLIYQATKLGFEDMQDYMFTSPVFVGSSDAREAVGQLVYECLTCNDENQIPSIFASKVSQCKTALL